MTKFRTVLFATSILSLLAASVAACTPDARPSERSTDQPIVEAANSDWSLLGGGQCLAAMQAFYPSRFGVTVPVARSSYNGSCAPEGACHVWLDDRPDDAVWDRIANDGSRRPVRYDLVVYPPVGRNPYGHVASVDHVDDAGTIWVMDANWNGDERRSSAPHPTPGYVAYGWYHLKQLGTAVSADDPRTCGNIAVREGFGAAACEWNGNAACGGMGVPSSDCDHCCDTENPAPTTTGLSCGQLAARLHWGGGALCEWNDNRACGGVGPVTSDCDHCCVH